MLDRLPQNEDEFNSIMQDIDDKLISQEIAIHNRSIQAVGEICIRYKISLNIAPLSTEPILGNYSGDSLSIQVIAYLLI